MNIAHEWFDGCDAGSFATCLAGVEEKYRTRLESGSQILIFLESPSNPFGYVMDLPAICKTAHRHGWLVLHDATVGTPFLIKPLRREDKRERPDYVIHSYTKDLTGNGNATAGVVIGENHRMFLPKGETERGISWEQTLFWSVYYIKGAFLDADKAFEVISGMKTLEQRMLRKCINTLVLVRALDKHPLIQVNANAVSGHPNGAVRERVMYLGLPAPLFTIDFSRAKIARETFVRFFDNLSPGLDHQVSLGQSNTVCLCPALTSHSEMSEEALKEAGITTTTIRIAVGLENPKEILAHLRHALALTVDQENPGFSDRFLSDEETDHLVQETYLDVHRRFVEDGPKMATLMQ